MMVRRPTIPRLVPCPALFRSRNKVSISPSRRRIQPELRLYYYQPGKNTVTVYPIGIGQLGGDTLTPRPEETTAELQSLRNTSYAGSCLKKNIPHSYPPSNSYPSPPPSTHHTSLTHHLLH
ncbi:hypothetical protein GEP11_23205, partial [Salmonella enterica subsp. enterica serovar Anatum]|nr:hypothetical protein [Salmonella enterica subsp. enterica serovar Anatum]